MGRLDGDTGPKEVCLLKLSLRGTEVQSWVDSLGAVPAPPERRPRMLCAPPVSLTQHRAWHMVCTQYILMKEGIKRGRKGIVLESL